MGHTWKVKKVTTNGKETRGKIDTWKNVGRLLCWFRSHRRFVERADFEHRLKPLDTSVKSFRCLVQTNNIIMSNFLI